MYIIESIDSIFRDGADMPISLNKCKGSNADVSDNQPALRVLL